LKPPFHPLVQRWFAERFQGPTPAQAQGWVSIAAGKSTLIAAPTGSGKTLAAFLWSIDRLIKRALEGGLDEQTSVVYVSPLKALGNQSIQAEVSERQQEIAQTMQLETLNRQLVTVLASLAMKTNDEQLKKILAESGVNLGNAPENAPAKK